MSQLSPGREPQARLRTARLVLAPYENRDRDPFLALVTDPDTMRHMNGALSAEAGEALLARFAGGRRDACVHAWAIRLPESDEYIGHVFLVLREENPDPELGFIVGERFRRRRFAVEAAKGVLEHLGREGYRRVFATVDVDHVASQGVLDKLGFTRCGEGSDENGPYFKYDFDLISPRKPRKGTRDGFARAGGG